MIGQLISTGAAAEIESVREARKAAIAAVRALQELNTKLMEIVGNDTNTTAWVEANDESIERLSTEFDLLFDLPEGSYWDAEHLTALSESEANGEIILHKDLLSYHDGDSDKDKSETEFAIKMVTYLTTIHPNCWAR